MANDIKAKIEVLFDDKELRSKLNSIKKEYKIEIEAKISSQDMQKISAQLDTIKKKMESTKNSLQAYANKLNSISTGATNDFGMLLTTISKASGIVDTISILSNAFRNLNEAINPLGPIVAVLSIAFSAFSSASSNYKQRQQELLVNAQNSTSALKEETSAINEQISSITEQRKLLDSSNTTGEEAANVKSQLLEIQNSLIESYGLEAEGLDLVNGKLEDQINILQNISKDKASQWLTENRSTIKKATTEMETVEDYKLGTFIDSTTDSGVAIKNIAMNFEKLGIKVEKGDENGFTYMINFHGDAENAEKVISDFSSKVRQLQNEFGENDSNLKNVLDLTSSSYNEVKSTLDDHKKIYETSIINRAIESDATSKLFMDYAKAINEYNNALANGDGVKEAKANFETIKASVNTVSEQYPFFSDAIALVDKNFSISTKSMVNSANDVNNALNKEIEIDIDLASAEDVLDELSKVYDIDYENYKEAVMAKLLESEYFYNNVINNLPDWVKDLSDSYGIELGNYSNYLQVKHGMDKEYSKKQAELQQAQIYLDKSKQYKPKKWGDEGYNPVIDGPFGAATMFGEEYWQKVKDDKQKQLDDLDKIIDGVELTLVTTLNQKEYTPSGIGKTKKDETPFSDSIDWSKSSIEELNRDVNNAKDAIDKNSPYDKQKKDITALITLQKKLATGYMEQAKTYKRKYGSSLKGIENYQDKIESGEDFTIEDFKGKDREKEFKQATKAREYYKQFKDAKDNEIKTRKSINENRAERTTIKIKADFEDFDKKLSDVNKVLSEIDLNVDFVDEGSIEQLVLLQSGYEQSSKSAKMLRSEISKLDKQYTQGKIDLETYTERVEDLNKKELDAVKSMKKYQDSIISSVKNRYDKELDLSKKALEKKLKDIETERKTKIEALEDEIKKYKEIIDTQKKALKDQQETDDHNEQVAKFNTEISKMESRLSLLKKAELTGDREAGKERKQLEDDLAKKKEELAKLQKERGIDLAIDALDEEYDAYEKMKNQEIKDTEKKYEDEKIEAQNAYDLKESNLNKLYENEKRLIIEAASLTKEKFTEAFDEINRVLSQYGMSASPELSDLFNDTQKSVSRTATDMLLRTGTGTTGNSELNQYIKSKYGSYLSYSEMVELAKMLGVPGINSAKDVQGTTSNRTKILDALKKAKFEDGGYVLDDNMARKVGEHRVVLARNGEALFPENKAILFKELIDNIKPLNSLVKLSNPNMSNLISNNNSSPVINFNLNGGSITTEVMPQFNKWKSDIANEVSKIIMGGARQR